MSHQQPNEPQARPALANRHYRLRARSGPVPALDDFELASEPVRALVEGEALVRVSYLALTPLVPAWRGPGDVAMAPKVGALVPAYGVGAVLASSHPRFRGGEWVTCALGAQEYFIGAGDQLHDVDERYARLPRFLDSLGTTGVVLLEGLEELPRALIGLLDGTIAGQVVIQVNDE